MGKKKDNNCNTKPPKAERRTLRDIGLGAFATIQIILPLKDKPHNNILVVKDKALTVSTNRAEIVENGIIAENEKGQRQIKKGDEILYEGNDIRVNFFEKVKRQKKIKKGRSRGAYP